MRISYLHANLNSDKCRELYLKATWNEEYNYRNVNTMMWQLKTNNLILFSRKYFYK